MPNQNKTLYIVIAFLSLTAVFMCCVIVVLLAWITISNSGNYMNGSPTPTESCHIKECHGMDLTCGNGPQNFACTTEYGVGDGCRQFFNCVSTGASCGSDNNPQFTQCKSCVQQCISKSGDAIDQFSCESDCINSLK